MRQEYVKVLFYDFAIGSILKFFICYKCWFGSVKIARRKLNVRNKKRNGCSEHTDDSKVKDAVTCLRFIMHSLDYLSIATQRNTGDEQSKPFIFIYSNVNDY